MSTEKQYAVKLTAAEWGKVCRGIMTLGAVAGFDAGPLHRKICDQISYLSDEVLDSFNQ